MKSEISAVGKRQKVLQDLEGIYLVIEEITLEQEDPGLLEYQLQADLKLALRIAGIPVLSAEEWIETPGTPYLYVNVTVAEVADDSLAAYSLTLELHQNVNLSREPSITTSSSTWDTGLVNISAIGGLDDAIRKSLATLIEFFVEDFSTANPA
jgi:hypothetical protein